MCVVLLCAERAKGSLLYVHRRNCVYKKKRADAKNEKRKNEIENGSLYDGLRYGLCTFFFFFSMHQERERERERRRRRRQPKCQSVEKYTLCGSMID